jgi:hypothetical protein
VKVSRAVKRNFNVDEQKTQRTFDAMAAVRRHESGRMFIISELTLDHYL